jgi:hypothetical protein
MAGPIAKLLWMHNRLGYIYGSRGVIRRNAKSPIGMGVFTAQKEKI